MMERKIKKNPNNSLVESFPNRMNHREGRILALGYKVKHHSFKVSKMLNVMWDVSLSEISWKYKILFMKFIAENFLELRKVMLSSCSYKR